MSLYQKYRPRDFSTVVGQSFVKTALSNACRLGTIHHGYIFHGSHGIGKTTLARILAKAVNCQNLKEDGNPCHECEHCKAFDQGQMIDVVEIDAASHTGVDNIRDLIEKAQFQPTRGKYKIYIIDEVHMLSKGAFNALLKILEEPPKHIIFILATTEIHKVPSTILSRVLQFDLTKITQKDIAAHLAMIAKEEGIKADEGAIEILARTAAGGMRDAISLFEQYVIDGKLTEESVREYLQLVDRDFLGTFFDNAQSADIDAVMNGLDDLQSQGIDMKVLIDQSLQYLHEKTKESIGSGAFSFYQKAYWALHEVYAKIRVSSDPFVSFSMAIYGLANSHEAVASPAVETKPKKAESPKKEAPATRAKKEEKEEPKNEDKEPETPADSLDFSISDFISHLKEQKAQAGLISILKQSTIILDGDTLNIKTSSFGKVKLDGAAQRKVLLQHLEGRYGKPFELDVSAEESQALEDDAKEVFG